MALIRTPTASTIAFERKSEELNGFWQTEVQQKIQIES